eukprot:1392697-Amorphochlora_amoeboformis.AAC.2
MERSTGSPPAESEEEELRRKLLQQFKAKSLGKFKLQPARASGEQTADQKHWNRDQPAFPGFKPHLKRRLTTPLCIEKPGKIHKPSDSSSSVHPVEEVSRRTSQSSSMSPDIETMTADSQSNDLKVEDLASCPIVNTCTCSRHRQPRPEPSNRYVPLSEAIRQSSVIWRKEYRVSSRVVVHSNAQMCLSKGSQRGRFYGHWDYGADVP